MSSIGGDSPINKRLFRQTPYLGLRLFLFLSLSILLLIADHTGSYTSRLRAVLSIVVAPIQYVVDFPMKTVDWVKTSVATHQRLLTENTNLRAQQILLQTRVQKLIALEKENQQLRALLKSSAQVNERVSVAQLLAVSSDPFIQQVVLNQGSGDRVYVGQPVLDVAGVMGQIVDVGPLTSQVLLITDTRSAVPVEIQRTGYRSIAVGTGSIGTLSLRYVPKTIDIKEGDILVTSGLGQRFPSGYPVGVVSSIKYEAGEHFAKIMVRPRANLNRSRLVLLVWSDLTNTPIKIQSEEKS